MARRGNPTASDFEDILRDGLSSRRSYVVLREKNRSPVYLCFKPFIIRLHEAVVYVGGKLSIFADTSHPKWAGLSDTEQAELLQKAWKKLPHDRTGGRRLGSNAGFYVAAGVKDQEKFVTKFDKGHMIHTLLNSIEEELTVEIANRTEVTAYLSMFYHENIKGAFSNYRATTSVPDRTIGKKSGILLGQKYCYGGGVLLQGFLENQGLIESKEAEKAA